jgi:hypothetical protein
MFQQYELTRWFRRTRWVISWRYFEDLTVIRSELIGAV